ncbi:MAG: hypothetical protein ACRD8Z_05580 [Nitrososphaeraceae archaeon]
MSNVQDMIAAYKYSKANGRTESVYEWTLFKMMAENHLKLNSLCHSDQEFLYIFLAECIFTENDQESAAKVLYCFNFEYMTIVFGHFIVIMHNFLTEIRN